MNKDIAKKWTAALTSGAYDQAYGALRWSSGFCCLGVLCDLYAKETERMNWSRLDGAESFRFGGNACSLPEDVRDWAGLRDVYGSLQQGGHTSLAAMNDDGHSFDRIAAIIDEKWEAL